MIDYTVIRQEIEVFIDSVISVPIQFENTRIPESPAFVAVTTQEATSALTGMNESSFQVAGDVIFQIYTPLFSGTDQSKQIASEIANALATSRIDAVTFQVPVLQSVGQVPETDLFQQNLIVPFNYFYAGILNSC